MPKRNKLVVVAVAGILILAAWSMVLSFRAIDRCSADPVHTIEQMLSLHRPQRMVPKDFVVEYVRIGWRVATESNLFILPHRDAEVISILPRGFRGTAICRVRGPDGMWWMVNGPDRSGFLSYVPGSDATLEQH